MRRFMTAMVALSLTAPVMMLTGCDSPTAQPASNEAPKNPSPSPAPGGGAAPAPGGEAPAAAPAGDAAPAPAPAPVQSPGL